MRLRRLDLTRYGKFTDHSIDLGERDAGKPDLHIIYGLNEAGKTTALSGFLDLLFGIEERTRYSFLHQGKAMEVGACIEYDGRAHELRRVKQRSNSLLNEDGQPINEAVLASALAGLTRDSYRMMFSLDDQTLEEGGNAILESKGDLGELLFSASAGLAGISSALDNAAAEADGIFRKRASSTTIAGLKRQISELKSRRDEIDMQASTYRSLAAALEQAEAAYDATMQEIGSAKARQNEIARVLRAHPLAAQYRRNHEELAQYQGLPHPPDAWTSLVPELLVEEARLHTQLNGLETRQQKLHADLEGLVADHLLLGVADHVDQLSDAAARYTTAQEDLPKRKDALSSWSRRIEIILASLGQSDVDDPKVLLVPATAIGELRDLIAERSGIDVALRAATKEHENARHNLEKEQRARQALEEEDGAISAGTLAQLQSILSRLRNGNLAAELHLAERRLTACQQAFDDAVAELHPWTGDGEALRRITPPAADRVEAWKTALAEIHRERSKIMERKSELSTRHVEDTARLAGLRDAATIIDDEEAALALRERDEAWTEHLARLERKTADHFEGRMRHVDKIAADRLASARQLEELRALKAGVAVIEAGIERQGQLLKHVDDRLEQLRGEINSQTPPQIERDNAAPVDAWLACIDRWTRGRAVALAAWSDLRQVTNEIAFARKELAREHDDLAKVLATVGIDGDGLDLPALVQAGDGVLADHGALQTRRNDAEIRLGDLEAVAAARKAALEEAAAEFDRWQRAWNGTLSSTWFADRQDSPGAVRELLDAISGLPEALREQDDLQHRIAAMEADRQGFIDMVWQLHSVLGEPRDPEADPLRAAKDLIRRREEAARIQENRQEREQALADLVLERERMVAELSLHNARKQELTSFFQVDTLGEARHALERCRVRDDLIKQQERIARQIVDDMQQPSLEEAMARLADADLAELQLQQAELTMRLDALDARAKDLFADKARASDRLNMLAGDDAAARLEAERRTSLLEIEEQALRYLRLKSGHLVAEQGIRAYRDKHRSAMMDRASEAFRMITRNEYAGLATRPEKEREMLIGLTRHGGSRLAIEMSKGTRFQLYLALRLAGYEEFAAARPSVPFIADDIMETFDEPRSEEVFRLLGQMSQVGQVIYLTHHRHLCEIAAQIVPQVHIHELASSA